MTQMINGLKILFSGQNTFFKQVTLFSVCGIAGLLNAYLSLGIIEDINEVTLLQKILLPAILIIFSMFLIGYETIFMHSRQLPEIDFECFKLFIHRVPAIVFLIGIPLYLISLFTKYQYSVFCIETIIAIPLTIMQAGFSYSFDDKDYNKLFKIFKIKDYFFLLLKRLWITISCYIISFLLLFITFFIIGFIASYVYKWDISSLGMLISSQQTVIMKLSTYILLILLTYTTSIGTLVWDYEVVKTAEKHV